MPERSMPVATGGRVLVPTSHSEAELRERGSRFLAIVGPAGDQAGATTALRELARQHPDATHQCWAWRLGEPPIERHSDAGEPRGTAGIPILQVLRGAGVSDVLVVVIRWFGGTKLGKGGLARAYAGVTKEALAGAKLAEKTQVVSIDVAFPYKQLGAVKRLVHPPQIEIESEDYGEVVRMGLQVETRRLATLLSALADLGVRVDRSSETGVD